MSNYYYDREADTYYRTSGDGFGWFAFFIILATPFFVISFWLHQYAEIVNKYPALTALVFLGFAFLLGYLLYRKRYAKHKSVGVLAVIISLLPVGFAQFLYAIPYILASDSAIGTTFEWLVVTFFTVGISFFVNQVCMLLKNGTTHLLVASAYLGITLLILL